MVSTLHRAPSTALQTTPPVAMQDYLPAVDPKAVEQALLIGDISQMSDEVRIAYYIATCRSLNLNPLTKPFQALKTDDGKVTLYPDKGCAEQLRKLHRVSVRVLDRQLLDDLYIVTVRATMPDGREEESQGIVPIAKPKGTWEDYESRGEKKRRFKPAFGPDGRELMTPLSAAERATAMMRAETKAKRRVTLAICGLGLPDADLDDTEHPMAFPFHGQPEEQHERPAVPISTATVSQISEELYAKAAVISSQEADAPTPPAPDATQAVWQAVNAALERLGWDETQKKAWENKQARRFKKSFSDLPVETLRSLLPELDAQMPQDAPQPPAGTTPPPPADSQEPGHATAAPGGHSEAPAPAWRGMLAGLLVDLADATLAREAQCVVEDPDISDADGNLMVTRILNALEAQDGGAGEAAI